MALAHLGLLVGEERMRAERGERREEREERGEGGEGGERGERGGETYLPVKVPSPRVDRSILGLCEALVGPTGDGVEVVGGDGGGKDRGGLVVGPLEFEFSVLVVAPPVNFSVPTHSDHVEPPALDVEEGSDGEEGGHEPVVFVPEPQLPSVVLAPHVEVAVRQQGTRKTGATPNLDDIAVGGKFKELWSVTVHSISQTKLPLCIPSPHVKL
jgi:hypothetical protein